MQCRICATVNCIIIRGNFGCRWFLRTTKLLLYFSSLAISYLFLLASDYFVWACFSFLEILRTIAVETRTLFFSLGYRFIIS